MGLFMFESLSSNSFIANLSFNHIVPYFVFMVYSPTTTLFTTVPFILARFGLLKAVIPQNVLPMVLG